MHQDNVRPVKTSHIYQLFFSENFKIMNLFNQLSEKVMRNGVEIDVQHGHEIMFLFVEPKNMHNELNFI